MTRQAGAALAVSFRGPAAARAYGIVFGFGTLATAFEFVALPSPAVGGFSLAALRYLTPSLAAAALFLGFGSALAIAVNIAPAVGGERARRASGAAGIGGLLASLLPGSLCCTSLVPSLLAALGASAPTVLGTTGKVQAVFALHEGAFIAASLAGVALSIGLALANRSAACSQG